LKADVSDADVTKATSLEVFEAHFFVAGLGVFSAGRKHDDRTAWRNCANQWKKFKRFNSSTAHIGIIGTNEGGIHAQLAEIGDWARPNCVMDQARARRAKLEANGSRGRRDEPGRVRWEARRG